MPYHDDEEVIAKTKGRCVHSRPLTYNQPFVDQEVEKLLAIAREINDLHNQWMRPNNPPELDKALRESKQAAEEDALYQVKQLASHVKIHHEVRTNSRRRQLIATLEYRAYRQAARKKKESAV